MVVRNRLDEEQREREILWETWWRSVAEADEQLNVSEVEVEAEVVLAVYKIMSQIHLDVEVGSDGGFWWSSVKDLTGR